MSPVSERPLRCPFFCFSTSPVWTDRALSDSVAAAPGAAVVGAAEAGKAPPASLERLNDPGAVLDPGTALSGAWVAAWDTMGWGVCGALDSREVPWEAGLVGGLGAAFMSGEPVSGGGRSATKGEVKGRWSGSWYMPKPPSGRVTAESERLFSIGLNSRHGWQQQSSAAQRSARPWGAYSTECLCGGHTYPSYVENACGVDTERDVAWNLSCCSYI